MASVAVTEKAHRLLVEGRLIVQQVKEADGPIFHGGSRCYIHATCRGDSGEIYDLGFDPSRNEWRCTCEARGRCAHLVALMLVTVRS